MRRFLNLGGKTLHVDLQQGGSARPIVFINSLGTDLRIWEAVMARLRGDSPVLRHDKSGHGLSSGQTDSIAGFAQDPDDDLDACLAQDLDALAIDAWVWIDRTDHGSRDACVEDRARAGRRAAMNAARLERDIDRAITRIDRIWEVGDRVDLGVRTACLGVVAARDDLARGRVHDHRTHAWVRVCAPESSPSFLEGCPHEPLVCIHLFHRPGFSRCAHVFVTAGDCRITPRSSARQVDGWLRARGVR